MADDWQRVIIERWRYQFPKHFSFEFGPGWGPIMDELCRRVDAVLDDDWKDGQSFQWTQCKEKFGSGRFYNSGPDEVERHVDWAEAVTLRTCEQCGQPGIMRRDGWFGVRCDEHAS
ncbi:hypothetical protein ASG43_21485 [Aureimonas sp. Leaf454]|uniref:hypothetical protein n=1 Tax=Aureimonas sp. Leaf454 TaxID=1736381 RepID=UPI0006FC4F8E|nr:hypothetical protein [Aureimonas sp. Leaf454]KQT51180.1 hypothetical protein ASG43_21485 [Aureimonas sp. Leaf454]